LAAVRLLRGREHSRAELAAKLRSRGLVEQDIGATLDDLVARGLLSDRRFVEQFVASRMSRGAGPMRIGAELRRRGVSDELIERYLERDPELWMRQLRQVYDRKYGSLPPRDRKEQARRARFLQQRGFTGEQIWSLLGRD
jgi:regulatory protein